MFTNIEAECSSHIVTADKLDSVHLIICESVAVCINVERDCKVSIGLITLSKCIMRIKDVCLREYSLYDGSV